MLRILGRANSGNVQKVLWLCAELGIAHEREDVGGPFGKNREPAYLALNPNGLVPTILDDGKVVWESNTILRYLASRDGATALYPSQPYARSLCDRWLDWQLASMGPGINPLFLALVRTPPEKRDPAAVKAARDRTAAAMAVLDGHLANNAHLAGDDFTIADIANGIFAYRWFVMDIAREDLPNLKAWYDRIAGRPGFRTHVAIGLS